jgi:hypothetical protein
MNQVYLLSEQDLNETAHHEGLDTQPLRVWIGHNVYRLRLYNTFSMEKELRTQ